MGTTVKTGNELAKVLHAISSMVEDDMIKVMSKLSIDAFRELIIRSAVDTGYLRSNWQVTTKRPPNKIKSGGDEDGYYKDATYPPLVLKLDSTISHYNNTEYAIHLENGTAYQRAQPMVEPTYQKMLSEAKTLAYQLSNRKYNV